MRQRSGVLIDEEGHILKKSLTFDDNVEVSHSCTTMLNGEALIFGGWNMMYQVQIHTFIKINFFFRFPLFQDVL